MKARQSRRMLGAAASALLLATVTILGQTPAPQTPYENLKSSVQGTRVTITYDLVSADPNDVFKVALDVKMKGTSQIVPVTPASVSGDGAGSGLRPGKGKTIVWNAGMDVEVPQFDLYDISIVIDRVVTGEIAVESDPQGATVVLDSESQPRGVTPLRIEGLTPGSHRIAVSKDGYLQNSQEAIVEVGKTTAVRRTLTQIAVPPPQRPGAPGAGGTSVPPKSGGIPKWVIPVAGGGAAVALLGLKGKGSNNNVVTPPATACTFSLSPGSFPNSPPQAGGSTTVNVSVSPATCSPQTWQATVPQQFPFVHVSPASGTGNQPIQVSVDANPPEGGVASRDGAAVIAGITFTISGQTNAVTTTGSTAASDGPGSLNFAAVNGVNVVAGQKLTITASTAGGSITLPVIGQVGPAGTGAGNAGSQGRLPGAAEYALICGINGQTTLDLFLVGTGITKTADKSGPLFCGMNAPTPAGFITTSGTWSLTVTIGG